jgi:hypothetical protein
MSLGNICLFLYSNASALFDLRPLDGSEEMVLVALEQPWSDEADAIKVHLGDNGSVAMVCEGDGHLADLSGHGLD